VRTCRLRSVYYIRSDTWSPVHVLLYTCGEDTFNNRHENIVRKHLNCFKTLNFFECSTGFCYFIPIALRSLCTNPVKSVSFSSAVNPRRTLTPVCETFKNNVVCACTVSCTCHLKVPGNRFPIKSVRVRFFFFHSRPTVESVLKCKLLPSHLRQHNGVVKIRSFVGYE
jgi:hypothetical protein